MFVLGCYVKNKISAIAMLQVETGDRYRGIVWPGFYPLFRQTRFPVTCNAGNLFTKYRANETQTSNWENLNCVC